MKKSQVVLAFALAFSLGLNIVSATYAAETPADAIIAVEGNVATVGNEAGLNAALSNEAVTVINLDSDIALTTKVTVHIDRAVQINLGGHTISSPTSVFIIDKGTVEFVNGTIAADKQIAISVKSLSATPDSQNYTNVTIGKDVTVTSQQSYAAAIEKNAYGAKMTIAGKLEAPYVFAINGLNNHIENCAEITITDDAELIGGVGYANENDPEGGVGVYAAGYAKWNIGAAKISGDMGFAIKAGTVKFNNTEIHGAGEYNDPSGVTSGIASTGAAIQIEEHASYAGGIKLEFNGGKYTSANNSVFHQYQASGVNPSDQVEGITINGGTFIAAADKPVFSGVPTTDTKITEGKFSSDINEWSNGVKFLEHTTGDQTFWMTQAAIDAEKPVDPEEPEIPADVQQIQNQIQTTIDKIRADETFVKYETLVKAVDQAELRLSKWGETATTRNVRVNDDYDAALIMALGNAIRALGIETELGRNLPATISKADLENAVKEAKSVKNYTAYAELADAVWTAEKALADGEVDKTKLKELLARIDELSEAADPEDPAKPIIPGINDGNGSGATNNSVSDGTAIAPNTGVRGNLNDSISTSIIACVVSGGLLAGAIIFRHYNTKRKTAKAERDFIKM